MSAQKQGGKADPRFQRVRASLRQAALSLCSSASPEQVSVAQIAQEADVHRTSFYSHAASVSQLLTDALWQQVQPEIEALHQRLFDGEVLPEQYWLSYYRIFLRHVQQNQDIYLRLLEENSSTVVSLRRRVEQDSRSALEQVLSHWPGQEPDELWIEMALQQHSAGVFAVTASWLKLQMKPSVDEVLATYRTMAPPWQLAREEGGRISIRRSRL